MKSLNKHHARITELTISAILGSDPAQSKTDIMRSLVREWHHITPDVEKSRTVTCDHEQLRLAKDEFETRTGMVIGEGGFYSHADNSLLGASVCGFLSDDIIAITCYQPTKSSEAVNAQHYLRNHRSDYDRVQFQLHCVGAAICHFIVKTPLGMDSTAIARDQQWMETNKAMLNHFLSTFLKVVNNEKLSKPYLIALEYNADEDKEWLALAEERLILKTKLDTLNKALKSTNSKLTEFAKKKDCKVIGAGIQAFKMVRKGAIQYAKIPELKDINMDKYRKKDAEYWTVR